MFITEDITQRSEHDKIRMEIIRKVMSIYDPEQLQNILYFVDAGYSKELPYHPSTILEVAEMTGFPDVVRILDVLKGMDLKLMPYNEMYEAFCISLDKYTGFVKGEE